MAFNLVFNRINRELKISPPDVEISIFETSKYNRASGDYLGINELQ
ncbi:tautomerase family protein [Halalkalibacterium halodurans]|nr:tautomerase family protein [Halalkalibacterium halodurans]TPE68843.1 tautomerase family protein [Halalkalibacterium halodurans]